MSCAFTIMSITLVVIIKSIRVIYDSCLYMFNVKCATEQHDFETQVESALYLNVSVKIVMS